jgi:hypothetical protein
LPPCDGAWERKASPSGAHATCHCCYYCEGHIEWVRAGEDYDDLSDALYWSRRFLWKAEVENIERLEHHLGTAMSELDENRMRTNGRIKEAASKAGMEDE